MMRADSSRPVVAAPIARGAATPTPLLTQDHDLCSVGLPRWTGRRTGRRVAGNAIWRRRRWAEARVTAQPRARTREPVSFAVPRGPERSRGRSSAIVLHVFNYFAPDFTGEGIYATKLFVHLQ